MGYIFIYPYLSVIEWHSIPTHICLKAKPPKWMIWTTVSKAGFSVVCSAALRSVSYELRKGFTQKDVFAILKGLNLMSLVCCHIYHFCSFSTSFSCPSSVIVLDSFMFGLLQLFTSVLCLFAFITGWINSCQHCGFHKCRTDMML